MAERFVEGGIDIIGVISRYDKRERMRSSDHAFLTRSAAVLSLTRICNKKGRLEKDGAKRGAE